jgi:hypothetical protein
VPTVRSTELREIALRLADRLPVEAGREIVLTGSTSRGVADELSDVELLAVPPGLPPLDGILAAEIVDHARLRTAEALANGLPLRTEGGLAAWQRRLAVYPPALADAIVEDAVEIWGGDPPETMLTLLRPGDRLALTEWLRDDTERVLRILHALNRAWEPGWKRLPAQVAALAVKPDRVVERIEEALLEPDGRRALRLSAERAADAVALAPATLSVARAREWLTALVEVLR